VALGKSKTLGLALGAILLGAIAILGILRAASPDPARIKSELGQELEALNRIPPEEALRKDAKAEEILTNEEFREHARALYVKVEKIHPRLHEAAELERAAQRVVPRLLARCVNLEQLLPKELHALSDEARAHLGNYGATRFGVALRDVLRKIDDLLTRKPEPDPRTGAEKSPEDGEAPGAERLVKVQREVGEAVRNERFSSALEVIDRFLKRTDDDDLRRRANDLRESVLRKARKASQALLERARALAQEGQPGEAARLLDSALPNYKGLPENAVLEVTRRQLRP
jgi:hypothetical protein